ncbi:uncharacterized protein LOC116483306 [Hylobates moloch]|uniref:uncharacterized protein LOC116483306 n=1 Tax=Hylobates moloch TaxID=81572 RepID=UPI001362EA96|nr:uncharacterized protein LOC116483306 [Hylobates moloch]
MDQCFVGSLHLVELSHTKANCGAQEEKVLNSASEQGHGDPACRRGVCQDEDGRCLTLLQETTPGDEGHQPSSGLSAARGQQRGQSTELPLLPLPSPASSLQCPAYPRSSWVQYNSSGTTERRYKL